jgi:uncharacterized protein (DUF2164 family)
VKKRDKAAVTLPDKSREQAMASLRRYIEENLDQKIGDLKAALFLDYILEEHGPAIYNQAIADARRFFEERSADLGAVGYQAEFPYWIGTGRSK